MARHGQSRGKGKSLIAGFFAAICAIAAACSTQNDFRGGSPGGGGGGGGEDGSTTTRTKVASIALTFVTGNDSLRLDSVATATMRYADGTTDALDLPFYAGANDAGGVQNFTEGSTTTIVTDVHSSADLQSIEVSLVSHPIPDIESNDSWTLKELRASITPSDGGAATCVLDRNGGTITDNQPLVAQAGGCGNGSSLELLVVTGSDDLRSDSTASVTVNAMGSTPLTYPLTGSFASGTTTRVDIPYALPQLIDSVVFSMTSHPNSFESNDNWDISQVEALVSGADGGAPMCIIDAVGKSITDNVTLTLMLGGCPVDMDAGADAQSDASLDASDAAD